MTRDDLIDHLCSIVSGFEPIRAAWLGGSDASGRTDALSDVDLMVIAEDDAVDDVVAAIERRLRERWTIQAQYRVVTPVHPHAQTFYGFVEGGPELLLDCLVMRASEGPRFLEYARHGDPIVIIDRDGFVVPGPLEPDHMERLRKKHADLLARFPIFQCFVTKCLERGQPTDAMQFFRMMTLIPLVELLRIHHCPDRFDFGLRYLDRDLPADLKATIDRLSYAADMKELHEHHQEAVALFEAFAALPVCEKEEHME